VKEGKTTNDLFAFLTTELNGLVAPIHPKAMPVILTTPEEVEAGMTVRTRRLPCSDRCLTTRSRALREAKRRMGRYFDRRTGLCLFLAGLRK
jgi:putative SOS response-associated peptidase YedK